MPEHPFCQSDGIVLEHRLVAEKYLLNEENSVIIDGRAYLKKEYVVHHKNHDRLDNRVENLEIMRKGDHSKMHCKERKMRRDAKSGRFICIEVETA